MSGCQAECIGANFLG